MKKKKTVKIKNIQKHLNQEKFQNIQLKVKNF